MFQLAYLLPVVIIVIDNVWIFSWQASQGAPGKMQLFMDLKLTYYEPGLQDYVKRFGLLSRVEGERVMFILHAYLSSQI